MLYSGTDPESYITEYSLVYEDKISNWSKFDSGQNCVSLNSRLDSNKEEEEELVKSQVSPPQVSVFRVFSRRKPQG